MKIDPPKLNSSHGDGCFKPEQLRKLGSNVVFESGVLIFNPQNVEISRNVYIGHNTILKAYHENLLVIGKHTWIGQSCFMHSAGGIFVGQAVGIGPAVKIITSQHAADDPSIPILFTSIECKPVVLKNGCDIGVGSVICPGVTIGQGAIIGAGSVVNRDVPALEVWAGVPARKIKQR
jgi:acetyltransferase-like isoleucine patch superfamily enzyme